MALLRQMFRGVLSAAEFKSGAGVILICTVVEFLSVRAGIFMITSMVALVICQRMLGGDLKAKLATYWIAVFLFPPLQASIPGLGDINRLIVLDHFRIAGLVLLLPSAFTLTFERREKRPANWAMDIAIFAYPVVHILLQLQSATLSAILRATTELVLDLGLPYYVMTRGVRTWEELRSLLRMTLLACMFAASVAFLEAALQKNIYSDLEWVYGMRWSLTHTLMRAGMNRVQAMTPEPIIFALQILLTMGLWAGVAAVDCRKSVNRLVALMLAVAMFLTWSRGPWFGAIIFGMALLAVTRLSPRIFGILLVAALVGAVGLKAGGADENIMALLKGVFGSSREESGSIEYRNRLLDTALALIKQSPWTGVPNYAAGMQDLVQGEGIIDLVNAYLTVMLESGAIGLVLFVAPFIVALSQILRALRAAASDPEARPQLLLLRAFAALIVGVMATIFTTSVFERVPFILLLTLVVPSMVLGFIRRSEGQKKRGSWGNAPVSPAMAYQPSSAR